MRDSKAHSTSTGSPNVHGPGPEAARSSVTALASVGQPGAEIGDHPFGHRTECDALFPGDAPDALEPFGDPLQTLRVRFKMGDQLPAGRIGILPQVSNPSRETHQRRAQLMRRLPRHRHPEPIARAGHLCAIGPHRERGETQEQHRLQSGEQDDTAPFREHAVVNGADARLYDGRVDRVEPLDPLPQSGRVRAVRQVGGGVVHRRDASRIVGNGDRDAERARLRREVQERVGGRVGARVVQPHEGAAEQPSRFAGVVPQVAHHDPGVAG